METATAHAKTGERRLKHALLDPLRRHHRLLFVIMILQTANCTEARSRLITMVKLL